MTKDFRHGIEKKRNKRERNVGGKHAMHCNHRKLTWFAGISDLQILKLYVYSFKMIKTLSKLNAEGSIRNFYKPGISLSSLNLKSFKPLIPTSTLNTPPLYFSSLPPAVVTHSSVPTKAGQVMALVG